MVGYGADGQPCWTCPRTLRVLIPNDNEVSRWRQSDQRETLRTKRHGEATLVSEKDANFESVMLSAVDKGLVTLERLIAMMNTNPKRIFSLSEQLDTHVEVDLSKKYFIKQFDNDYFDEIG